MSAWKWGCRDVEKFMRYLSDPLTKLRPLQHVVFQNIRDYFFIVPCHFANALVVQRVSEVSKKKLTKCRLPVLTMAYLFVAGVFLKLLWHG